MCEILGFDAFSCWSIIFFFSTRNEVVSCLSVVNVSCVCVCVQVCSVCNCFKKVQVEYFNGFQWVRIHVQVQCQSTISPITSPISVEIILDLTGPSACNNWRYTGNNNQRDREKQNVIICILVNFRFHIFWVHFFSFLSVGFFHLFRITEQKFACVFCWFFPHLMLK